MERIVTKKEICEWLGITSGTLDRWRKSGAFPESIGVGRLMWTEQQISEWLAWRCTPVPDVTSSSKRKQVDKDRKCRIQSARLSLENHRKAKVK